MCAVDGNSPSQGAQYSTSRLTNIPVGAIPPVRLAVRINNNPRRLATGAFLIHKVVGLVELLAPASTPAAVDAHIRYRVARNGVYSIRGVTIYDTVAGIIEVGPSIVVIFAVV